jgi:hypothetical protein
MLDDLDYRPFPRRLGAPEYGVREARGPSLEPGQQLGRDGEGIAVAEEVEQRADVGGRGRGRVASGVGEARRGRAVLGGQRITIASPYE